MSNSFFTHDSPFIAGSLVRANEANAKFDSVEVGFEGVEAQLGLSISFEAFAGNTVIPSQTYANKIIWINEAGNVSLYSMATFAANVAAVASNASAAAASETAAAASASAASASQSAAAGSASAAAGSQSAASSSAAAALASENAAAASAVTANSEAVASAASATTSLSARDAAAVSAAAALASETNAASSESASAASQSATAAAKAAAEAARDATLASFDSFDDRYLGAKASEPSVDNDGNALVAGTLYFNTATENMKLYTGSAWVNAYVDPTGLSVEGHTHTEADITDRTAPVKLDDITTVAAQSTYNLTSGAVAYLPASETGLLVSFNGVIQEPNTAFTITGDTITFTFAVSSSDTIDYIIDLTRAMPVNSLVGNSIADLGDVAGLPSPTNGQALIFNSVSGYWEPTNVLGGVAGISSASPSGTAMTIDAANDVTFSGSVSAAALTETSSLRYKKNVQPISGNSSLITLKALQGVMYDRKDGSARDELGLIAEEVAQVSSSLVGFDEEGRVDSVKYTRLIPHLLEAVKELSAKVEELQRG